MNNCMKYKDYYGTVEYSDADECFHGKVLGIHGLVTFEGESVQELKKSFQEMIDLYIADCEEKHISPNKSYKGTFNVRIAPKLHRKAALCAADEGISLNALVEKAILAYTDNNYNEIADICKSTHEPVFLTKSGEGDLVVMYIETYNNRETALDLREHLSEVEELRRGGVKDIPVEEVSERMRNVIKGRLHV